MDNKVNTVIIPTIIVVIILNVDFSFFSFIMLIISSNPDIIIIPIIGIIIAKQPNSSHVPLMYTEYISSIPVIIQ